MDKVKSNGQIFGGAADLFKSNLISAYQNRAYKTIFWFDFNGYRVTIVKDYDMWQMTIKDPDNEIILSERAFNCLNIANGDYKCTRWSNAVVDAAVKLFFETVGNMDDEYADELDDMFEYAAEAHDEIENFCDEISMAYGDVEYEAHLQNPDYDYIKERINDLYDRLWDVANELGWCLHRCDERTGCNIWWDDFCKTEYFKDLKIAAGYDCTVTEFIDFFDNEPDLIMDDILAALADGVDDYDAFRNFINDETDFHIAA